MALVRLERVWYRYPGMEEWALRDVTLGLGEGRILVAGGTGSGKTTLLRVISGSVEVFEGELRGRVERRARTVMVPQVHDMFILGETVLDELVYSLENAGVPPERLREEAEALAARLGLERLLDRRVTALSAGERQRLAIASALALGAEVLLLDEPLAFLDPAGARGLLRLLDRSGARAVIVAEHRLHYLEGWPDLVVEMGQGRVLGLHGSIPRRMLGEDWCV